MTKGFYQIPLSRESWSYQGVVTPFKGVQVYVRSVIGMPGSETVLEELTRRVFRDFLQVAKVADYMYGGADSLEDLLEVWRQVLAALQRCTLNLSAIKTTVALVQTSILGWVWCRRTIQASPHHISNPSVMPPPKTVMGLRSLMGHMKYWHM